MTTSTFYETVQSNRIRSNETVNQSLSLMELVYPDNSIQFQIEYTDLNVEYEQRIIGQDVIIRSFKDFNEAVKLFDELLDMDPITKLHTEINELKSQNEWLKSALETNESWLKDSNTNLKETQNQLRIVIHNYRMLLYELNEFKAKIDCRDNTLKEAELFLSNSLI